MPILSSARKALIFRVALAGACAVTLYFALSPKPPEFFLDQFGDKFEHSLAFVVLTILASGAFPATGLLRIAERLSFLGALIEVVQGTPAINRDCDIIDWLFDTLAIMITAAIIARIRHRYAVR